MKKPLQPVHKSSLMKHIREFGTWQGYVAPNKVNVHHIQGGWVLGHSIMIAASRDKEMYVINPDRADYIKLNTYIENYRYYSCNTELGNTVRFWEEY
jgi:hypothetical protein